MKIFNSLISIFLFPILVNAQWLQSSIDTGMVNTASFLNKDTFLVSNFGNLELTLDGGETFKMLPNYKSGDLDYLVYKSMDTIFAVGYGTRGIVYSYDAGNTWFTQRLIMPNGDTAFKKKNILFFGFFDESNGIIFGDSLNGTPQVFLTNNGGLSWQFYSHVSVDDVVYSNIDLFNLYFTPQNFSLFPDGTARLLIGSKCHFLTMKQYGKVWSVDSDTTRKYSRIAFKDSLNGLARLNVPSGLARTYDGGITWVEIPDSTRKSNGNLLYVKGTPKYNGFYLANTAKSTGETNVSYDDGNSWQKFDTLNHGGGTVFFKDAETGVCSETIFAASSPIYYYKPLNTGVKNVTKKSVYKLHVYPNPANNEILFDKSLNRLLLFDIQGKLLKTASNTNRLEVGEIPAGMYWLKMTDEHQQISTQKIVIQH